MAPTPHNNTDILYVDYNTGTVDHTAEFRYDTGNDTSAIMACAIDCFEAVSPALSTINIIGARVQLEGTNVSFPVAWTGASSYGGGSPDRQNEASFIAAVGRAPDGRRVRVSFFGYGNTNDLTNFRLSRGADAVTDDLLTALEANPAVPLTIGGDTPAWKQYSNIGISAYWQRQFR